MIDLDPLNQDTVTDYEILQFCKDNKVSVRLGYEVIFNSMQHVVITLQQGDYWITSSLSSEELKMGRINLIRYYLQHLLERIENNPDPYL